MFVSPHKIWQYPFINVPEKSGVFDFFYSTNLYRILVPLIKIIKINPLLVLNNCPILAICTIILKMMCSILSSGVRIAKLTITIFIFS